MICQIDDLQAECRQVIAEEPGEEVEWEQSNEIPRSKRDIEELADRKEKSSKAKNAFELRFKVFSKFIY